MPKRFAYLLIVLVVLLAAVSLAGCGKSEEPASTSTESEQPAAEEPAAEEPAEEPAAEPAEEPAATGEKTEDVTELKIEDIKGGTGAEAVAGKNVTVHYTGWLTDGTKFDSSKDRGQPFVFPLGAGRVIAGWDQGVQGMKVGGTRKLTIPPALGYGAAGAGGSIPPNATLVFEVELLDVQ